jgi:hypothetical protein
MKNINNHITIALLIISFSFILACSDDKITGTHDIPEYIVDTTLYNAVKFDSSHTRNIANYPNNTKIIIGNFNDITTKTLLRFRNMPDTTWLDTVQLQECTIELKKDTLYTSESFDINVHRLNQSWNENTVTADSLSNGAPELITAFTIEDSISIIDIDTSLVTSWIVEDSLNFGLILSPAENCTENFVEFYSSETNSPPSMKITYIGSSGNADTLSIHATDDTFVGIWDVNPPFDTPFIANLPPTEMIFGVELTADSLGLTDEQFQMIVINRAEIIIDGDCVSTSYFSDGRMGLTPYIVPDEYIPGCETTYYSIDSDSLVVDISGILQGYARGEIEEMDIAVRSTTFNKDFSFIEFIDPIIPKLKIIYTYPILADN